MKAVRLLFLLFVSSILFASAAASAEPDQTPDQRLIGIWEEYEPSSNFVQFFPDHTVRLYLTEEEGGDSNTHWIGGKWSVSGSILTMNLEANGNEMSRQLKLVFDEKEMVMVDDDEGETRHRRYTGELPEKYRW